MPIGKDSITKRVAKVEPAKVEASEKEQNIAPELVATTAVAPKKAPAKKTSATGKTETARKPAAKKAPAKENTNEKAAPAVEVASNVLSNVAPETVEAVIGHKEDAKYEKVSIGDDMPSFLL